MLALPWYNTNRVWVGRYLGGEYSCQPFLLARIKIKGVNGLSGDKHKPGERADQSGIYRREGPRGGDTGDEVALSKGNRFPPGEKPGERYRLTRPTKTKRSN